MREIKFRVWDTQEKKFFHPTYEAYNGKLDEMLLMLNGSLVHRTMNGLTHESLFPDRYIKQQYTGLKDKHGKEIFEGDIIAWAGAYDHKMAVRWIEKGLYFDVPLQWIQDIEVIGNIFANPE